MAETGEAGQAITCRAENGFAEWMSHIGGSVVISTYQAGKVAIVGWNGTQIGITMRHFRRPMGMAVTGGPSRVTRSEILGAQPHAHAPRQLALATQYELLHFSDAELLAHDYIQPGRYDALLVPRVSYLTGNLNLHDMAFDADGALLIVNTRFSCLCKVTPQFSFVPIWHPPFVSLLEPTDRCHLNGLAMRDGKPAYATALGKSDTPRGWHTDRITRGILMRVPDGEILHAGLSMPHSPRLHAGRLWLLNSAQGELCVIDETTGRHEVVAALPGFLRGLSFVEGYDGKTYAIIGMSRVREKYLFEGLPVQKRFSKLVCGAAVVEVGSGRHVGNFEFTGGAEELYDVQFLHGVVRPSILNREKDVVVEVITSPEFSYWLRDDAPAKPASTPSLGAKHDGPEGSAPLTME